MASVPLHLSLLGELESEVMNHVWSTGQGEVKAVHSALGAPRGITVNTVQSTLKRLYEKGLLARHKVSHAYVYEPRVSREAFHHGLIGKLVGQLVNGQADALVSAFVDLTERAGVDQLQRLEALVAERLRQRDGGSR
ncbi:MAG: BlaI/MecI/CopY family transcriptional regulator [Deltaproteobacteria bacterium]|nr:BlaI/MecI/CopY family transcriptional regulator [Deltaproteobacteria bacterium]